MENPHLSVRPAWRVQWRDLLLVPALVVVSFWLTFGHTGTLIRYAAMGCVIGALVLTLVILYRHFAWRFTIGDDTIESRRGIIGRTIQSIRIEDLRNVNVHQSLIERMLGVGSVEFSTAAGGGVEVVFFGIEDPVQVKNGVQELQEQQERSGRTA